MRKAVLAGVAATLTVFMSTPVLAETAIGTACRQYAAAVADKYMSEQVIRLDGSQSAAEGHVTVHAYGRKYQIPRKVAGNGLQRASIGTVTREWGLVYTEERERCLEDRHLGEFNTRY
ncbi:MAG: hypothetical protein JNM45_03895 [Rhizobiales bacterium]|nr:hypothetical protein [Hyphomicrobiales bacterium]